MTVRLDLAPDVQAGLLSQAEASGMSLEAFAEQVLREKSREALPGSQAINTSSNTKLQSKGEEYKLGRRGPLCARPTPYPLKPSRN